MRKIVLFFGVLSILFGCEPTEDPLKASIEGMEEKITNEDVALDTALANTLTKSYLKFAKKNPQDSLAPIYKMRAAAIFKELPKKRLKAINTYREVVRDYPEHPQAAQATFMEGYVFDEKLDDRERAAKAYSRFLKKYPNHELAGDAKALLEMATDTLTDEQRVQQWLERDENKNPNP